MIPLYFEKLSQFDRQAEPCSVAVPFAEGKLKRPDQLVVLSEGRPLPTQCSVTSAWPDGSVRWVLAHFLADLPGNADCTLHLAHGRPPPAPDPAARAVPRADGAPARVETGALGIPLPPPGEAALSGLSATPGPYIVTADGSKHVAVVGEEGWRVIEPGPVRVVVETGGKHVSADGAALVDFTLRLYACAGKPWLQVAYQVLNREREKEVRLEEMAVELTREQWGEPGAPLCTALGISNYRTRIRTSPEGGQLHHLVDAEQLVYESNEQVPETLYGTFWAALRLGDGSGAAVTIHQAQQNFPKALTVETGRILASLLPSGAGGLTLARGMAKTHRLLVDFSPGPADDFGETNVRSLQFQMPDRPIIPPSVYREAGVLEDVWVDEPVPEVERLLVDLADNRTRGYGMLHWGDGPDAGYTHQGRGRGEPVWTNNEYDLPHAALLMYARTGERRFMDYLLVAAEHWMDVDVCHFSEDPLRHQGQVIHSARHVSGGVTVSHEWVEGLLDYYHLTGEQFAYETALGIGENVLRHLEQPALRTPAGSAARETGWALRTLVALYRETHDERWLAPAQRIVEQFDAWQRQYGAWLAPYTDHTLARVPFMIAVAANSLMRYWRVRPEVRVGEMIVNAVRDMMEHCLMPDGRFYYKELPSLQRRSAGGLVLEALACAYEICGDVSILEAGMPTFRLLCREEGRRGAQSGPKYAAGDAVIWPAGPGPKSFAAMFPPVMAFYRCAGEAGLMGASETG